MLAIELYQEFESLHGKVGDNWLPTIKKLSVPDIKEVASSIRFLNIRRDDNKFEDFSDLLDEEEWRFFEVFDKYARSEQFLIDILMSCQTKGKIVFSNPIGQGSIESDLSVCIGSAIFLRFVVQNEPIYAIQDDFSANALYFPLRKSVISISELIEPKKKIEDFLLAIYRNGEKYIRYFTSTRKWGGIYYGHQSPFHFFYFQYPGLIAAFTSCPLDVPNFYSFAYQYYLDIPRLFGFEADTAVLTEENGLAEEVLSKQVFVFGLGSRNRLGSNELRIRLMDDMLAYYVQRNSKIPQVQGFDFVIWVGVTTGKRIWFEEVESLVALIDEIAKIYNKVLLVIDGWTSTISQNVPVELYSADAEKAELIKKLVPDTVECVSLIGANPAKKIFYANNVDFFVANHATGSLFVSRICRKPGVTHISNSARSPAKKQHLHWDSVIIPEHLVHDIVEGTEQTDFHISYSIAPDEFKNFAMSVFKKKVLDRQ